MTWVSDSLTAHLGWLPTDLIGKHPWVIAVGEDAEKLERAFPVQGGRQFVSLHTRVRHVDGHLVDVRVVANVIIGADGRRLGGVGEWTVIRPDDPPSADGMMSRLTMPFRLCYDGNHVLREVEPHRPFLGWDPEALIGSYFSLGGLDEEVTKGLMSVLVTMGPNHDLGPTAILDADGVPVSVHVTLHLELDQGELKGYWGEVRVLG